MANNGFNPYIIGRLLGTDPPPRVSAGELDLLRRLIAEDTSETGEQLTLGVPGGWWLGSDRVDGRVCWRLIRHCLISQDGDMNGGIQYWRVNEEGREVIADLRYVPKILTLRAAVEGARP